MEAKDRVYNFISNQLTQGNLKRNDRITEQYLVDNLGISRTPVREALLQLAADNILEREPRKGFRIKTNSEQDVENLYELIGTLDGKIAETTINSLTEDDYSMMQFLIDSMYSAIDNSLYTKYNELQDQFHEIYISKSPNTLIQRELRDKKRIFIGKSYCRVEDSKIKDLLNATNKEHEDILRMMKNNESREVRNFLENVHWRAENARYDIW